MLPRAAAMMAANAMSVGVKQCMWPPLAVKATRDFLPPTGGEMRLRIAYPAQPADHATNNSAGLPRGGGIALRLVRQAHLSLRAAKVRPM